MSENKEPITWSWRNYLAPTPKLFLKIAEYFKGAFVLITSFAVVESVQTENPFWGIASAVAGYTLDQLIKFFGQANEDAERTVSIKISKGVPSDKVTVEDTLDETK